MSVVLAGVTKHFGQRKVLNNISFEVNKGEVTGFLGPNGAGKTTTMRIIAGVLSYSEGSVLINNMEVARYKHDLNRIVGYLPENNPLYNDLYVREFCRFVAGTYGIRQPDAIINRLIERTGLGPESHKLIGQLSKGYRQRVGLVQALIHDPQILILDEPTSGLDPNQMIEIRALIQELGKEKVVLLSTHIMQEVSALCDKIIVIHQGQIVANSIPIEELQQRTTAFKRIRLEVLQPMNLNEMIHSMPHTVCYALNPTSWIIESPDDIRAQLFDTVQQHRNKILTMQLVEHSLEEVFQQLTLNNQHAR